MQRHEQDHDCLFAESQLHFPQRGEYGKGRVSAVGDERDDCEWGPGGDGGWERDVPDVFGLRDYEEDGGCVAGCLRELF